MPAVRVVVALLPPMASTGPVAIRHASTTVAMAHATRPAKDCDMAKRRLSRSARSRAGSRCRTDLRGTAIARLVLARRGGSRRLSHLALAPRLDAVVAHSRKTGPPEQSR